MIETLPVYYVPTRLWRHSDQARFHQCQAQLVMLMGKGTKFLSH